jgi:hypothetical protein
MPGIFLLSTGLTACGHQLSEPQLNWAPPFCNAVEGLSAGLIMITNRASLPHISLRNLITKHFKETHCYQEQPHRGQEQKYYTELAGNRELASAVRFQPLNLSATYICEQREYLGHHGVQALPGTRDGGSVVGSRSSSFLLCVTVHGSNRVGQPVAGDGRQHT